MFVLYSRYLKKADPVEKVVAEIEAREHVQGQQLGNQDLQNGGPPDQPVYVH